MMQIYFDILNHLGVITSVTRGQTDGRTDRTVVSNSAVYRRALKMKLRLRVYLPPPSENPAYAYMPLITLLFSSSTQSD